MKSRLQRFFYPVLSNALLFLWLIPAPGLPAPGDSLRYELLLTQKMLSSIHPDKKFIPSIDITGNRLILLSTNDQFYLLGWGGITPIGKKVPGNIGSFAFTDEKLLLVIRNAELCRFDTLGGLSKLYTLPGIGMGICAGKYVMYVYNLTRDRQTCGLYALSREGRYSRLCQVPDPIKSVAELKNTLLFATGRTLFRYDLRNKQLNALATMKDPEAINSIAVDTLSNRIYFSTGNSVFAMNDTSIVVITAEFGGVLRFFNQGLIVFNPEKKILVRITGLEEKITSKLQTRKEVLAAKTTPETKPEKPVPAATAAVVAKETPPPTPAVIPAPAPVPPATNQKVAETAATPPTEVHLPGKYIRVERFITNSSGNLEKGKTYILKKDFSQPVDFLTNFPEGSVLKLNGDDPMSVKSWKIVQPSDGAYALIDSKLYMFFQQNHVWLIQHTP